ncbi:hypothetical protein IWQ61_004333 [Dispira simplex]|nr:hypothetical protein IWQ61_004333 [Dispira simplex]
MAQAMLTFSASLKLLTDRVVTMEAKLDHLQRDSSSSHKRTVAEAGDAEIQKSSPKRRRNDSAKDHLTKPPMLLVDKHGELQKVAPSNSIPYPVPGMALPRSPALADTPNGLSLLPEELVLEATPLHSNFFRLAEQFGSLSFPSRGSPLTSSVTGSTLAVPQVTPAIQPLDALYRQTPARDIPVIKDSPATTALHPSNTPIRPSSPTLPVSRPHQSVPAFSTPNPGLGRSGSPDIDERAAQSSPLPRIPREPWSQMSEPPRFCLSPNLDNPVEISNSFVPSPELSDNLTAREAVEVHYTSSPSFFGMQLSPPPASAITQGLGLQTQDFPTHS